MMLLPLTDTVAIPLLLEVAEIAPVPGRVATTVPLRVLSFRLRLDLFRLRTMSRVESSIS